MYRELLITIACSHSHSIQSVYEQTSITAGPSPGLLEVKDCWANSTTVGPSPGLLVQVQDCCTKSRTVEPSLGLFSQVQYCLANNI